MINNSILTEKAVNLIGKRLKNKRLTQQDSNYLSRFVRPKLRDMAAINAEALLKKLEYSPKALSIERKIKKIILKNIPTADTIIICGSAVQTNYKEYNDIDVIVATKKPLSKTLKEKDKIIAEIRAAGAKEGLNLDVQIYAKSSILSQYQSNPSLIYQLKDSKILYGSLNLPRKIKLSSLDLKMKLDWSEGLDMRSDSEEIYYAVRNAMLVSLLMNGKIDNYQLKHNLINIFGFDLLKRLRNNTSSEKEKKLALNLLNSLTNHLETELNSPKWEKIELETP